MFDDPEHLPTAFVEGAFPTVIASSMVQECNGKLVDCMRG
jgi:hypothetical protein